MNFRPGSTQVTHQRPMNGETKPDGKGMWMCGSGNYKGGDHHKDSFRVWEKGQHGGLGNSHTIKGNMYSSCICIDPKSGKVFAGGTEKWKGQQGGAKIVQFNPGQLIDETRWAEVRSLKIRNGLLYAA